MNRIKPLITAIIPTYKRPQWLKRAVRSVLAQSFPHFEILIADNASGEKTDKVTTAFLAQDARIKLLKHSTNIGAIANFSAALDKTTTPYVCFLPDDDFFAPFFFEEASAICTQYPEIAFCGGGGVMIDQQYVIKRITANKQTIPPSGYYPAPSGLFAYLRSSFGIAFPSLLFKTAILKEFGGFDQRIRNGADEHLVSQCAARYPVYLLTDKPYYFGFQHSGSLSNQLDYALFAKEAAFLHENLSTIPFSLDEKTEIDLFFKKRQLKILTKAYKHCCILKNFRQAKNYAEKIYALNPSGNWKRKRYVTALYQYVPGLYRAYETLKHAEKSFRQLIKRQKTEAQLTESSHTPPDADYWRAYTLQLEEQ